MIHEAGEIPTSALPYLVGFVVAGLGLHDVDVGEASGDEADEFADCLALGEGAAGDEAVVFAVGGLEDLHGAGAAGFGAVEVGEAFALVLGGEGRLTEGAGFAVVVWTVFEFTGILAVPGVSVDAGVWDVLEREVGVPLVVGYGEGEGSFIVAEADGPVVRVAVPFYVGGLADEGEEATPLGLEGVDCYFGAGFEILEFCDGGVVEAKSVFAEAVDACAGKDEGTPSSCIFDLSVAFPDCHLVAEFFLGPSE